MIRMLPKWLSLAGILLAAAPLAAQEITALRVETRGPGVADQEFVLAHIGLQEGAAFDRMALSRDVKALQKSERFSFVEARVGREAGGLALTFVVEPRLVIERLSIDGAEYLSNKKVRSVLELRAGDLVDDTILGVKAQKVKEKYDKNYFPDAQLDWTIAPIEDMPGRAEVHLTVKEGKRAIVRRIYFEGLEGVSAKPLRKAMKQKTANWLSWITNDGRLSPDDLAVDQESVRKAMMDLGYLDALVDEAEIRQISKRKVDIHIRIHQGRKYRMEAVSLDGNKLFPEQELFKGLRLKPGDLASLKSIEAAREAIGDFYGSRGYIRTDVDYEVNTDTNLAMAAVAFHVKESELAYINNIFIRGNTRTKDKVIRRELSVYPGEIYNTVKVRTSERRIRNLGYFSYVNTSPQSTLKLNIYDLVLDVEEQKTGQFMVGAGFSSIDEVIGFVELGQGNFDLFGWPYFTGGGQKVKVRAQVGTKRTDYEFSFIEPWFLNRRLSLGFDLFQHDSRFLSDEYDQSNIGGAITLGKPITAFDRLNLIYGLEEIDVYNVSSNASDQIKQEEGSRSKSSMTLEGVHDSRDSVFVASRGNRSSLSGTLAGGPFGGNTDLYLFQGRASQFWSLWFDHIFNLRGWAAMVHEYGSSDRVPIFDRLFLGGGRTLRAFKFREVGPKDDTGEPLGGRSALYGTAEYTIPIVEKIRIAAFYDIGVVWARVFERDEEADDMGDGDVNSGAGLGVRLDIPGFPIQLDYAWPIESDEYNDHPSGRFNFWIGYTY